MKERTTITTLLVLFVVLILTMPLIIQNKDSCKTFATTDTIYIRNGEKLTISHKNRTFVCDSGFVIKKTIYVKGEGE